MAAKTCAHPVCSCSVTIEETYCSEDCREASKRPEAEDCPCVHVGCLGAAGARGDSALRRGAPDGGGEDA